MSRTVTTAQQRSSSFWWRNVLTRGLLVLFHPVLSSGPLAHRWHFSNLNLVFVFVCMTGCVSADPHLVQSSVYTASQGWMDSEPSPPHGEILQVGRT